MKAEVTITDISHENLVDLLSVSMYGSDRFFARVKKADYDKVRTVGDCREDKLARTLLNGGRIHVYDCYAEGEDDFYGNPALPHEWDEDDQTMRYVVTLADVEYGLSKAFEDKNAIDYVKHLMYDPCQMDFTEADILLQFILFGEQIYG